MSLFHLFQHVLVLHGLAKSISISQDKRVKEDLPKGPSESGALPGSQRSHGLKKSLSGQRATMARLCEEGMILSREFSLILFWGNPIDIFVSTSVSVGVQKILHLIKSEDLEVQIQAVKVVANLAAEGVCDFMALYISMCQKPQIYIPL